MTTAEFQAAVNADIRRKCQEVDERLQDDLVELLKDGGQVVDAGTESASA